MLELGTGPDGKVGVLAGVKKDDCVMWDECETEPSCWAFDPDPDAKKFSALGIAGLGGVEQRRPASVLPAVHLGFCLQQRANRPQGAGQGPQGNFPRECLVTIRRP